MNNDAPTSSRLGRLWRHLIRNIVGYLALVIAVSMTPLPSWAAATIGTADIENGAVTTAKLQANAVKSSRINDGTIRTDDLAAAARGFTKIVTKSSTTYGVIPGAAHDATVVCDDGAVAISGGAYATPGVEVVLLGSTGGHVTKSHPTNLLNLEGLTGIGPSGDGMAPTGWRTTVVNTDVVPQSVTHYAICASK